MSSQQTHDADGWKYAEKAMTWYGWGSPVGLGLLIVSVGVFLVLVHHAGVF
jgi:hypothetical protein